MTDPSKPRVLLGEITTVHGIRGDVVIRSYTADPADIAAYGILETASGQPVPAVRIVRVAAKGVIAHLQGIVDRTTAEALRGTQLYVAREKLPPADAGEYYHADLIGLTAVAPNGSLIGEVIAVENFGAGDLLDIRLAGTNRTEFVAFTNAFVPQVDLAAGRMVVVMPEADEDDQEGEEPNDHLSEA